MSTDDAWIGSVFGAKYRIEAKLGTGAMGTVLLARHVQVGRAFAIKLLHKNLSSDATMCERFRREAQVAGRLHHRNCIGVVDVGEHHGRAFIVMELAQGTSLASMLHGEPLTDPHAFAILRQLCDGLEHAHSLGLIHRDFKPDNIIVEIDGTARIVDFGIALLREGPDSGSRLTGVGMILGTPKYMAPELAMGRNYDHRVDLFALGVVCYELFTGKMPFAGSGVDAVLASIATPTPAMDVNPLIEAFTHKLMAKDPRARPASARHARELLDLIERDPAAAARVLGVPHATPRPIVDEPTTAPAYTFRTAPTCEMPAQRPGTRWLHGALGTTAFVGAAVVAALVVVSATIAAQPPTVAVAVTEAVSPGSWRSGAMEQAPAASAKPRKDFTLRRDRAFAVAHPEPVVAPEPAVDVTPPAAPELAIEEPAVVSDAKAVARHYAAVGRRLTAMVGVVTDDQWRAYRRIRILEAMATEGGRLETVAILRELDQQLTARDEP